MDRNPSIRGRFKPGQSGNPRGRPPKRKRPVVCNPDHFRGMVLENLNQELTITRDGKQVKVTAIEAVLQRLLQIAITGKTSAGIKMYVEFCSMCLQQQSDLELKTAEILLAGALPLTGTEFEERMETYYAPEPANPPPKMPGRGPGKSRRG